MKKISFFCNSEKKCFDDKTVSCASLEFFAYQANKNRIRNSYFFQHRFLLLLRMIYQFPRYSFALLIFVDFNFSLANVYII